MGYGSRLEGKFEILPAPPKSLFDLEKLKRDPSVRWGWECIDVHFETESSVEVEEDGTEVTRSKSTRAWIEATCEEEHKHYYVAEMLQAIVNMLGPDRFYNGYFEGKGEDSDLWRFGIVDGGVRDFKPVITWPKEVS
jgi:hypothetical protein